MGMTGAVLGEYQDRTQPNCQSSAHPGQLPRGFYVG